MDPDAIIYHLQELNISKQLPSYPFTASELNLTAYQIKKLHEYGLITRKRVLNNPRMWQITDKYHLVTVLKTSRYGATKSNMSEIALKNYIGARIIGGKVVGCKYGDGIVRLGTSVLCLDCNYIPCRWDIDHNTEFKTCIGCKVKLPVREFGSSKTKYCNDCINKRNWASGTISRHKKLGYEVEFNLNDLYNRVKNNCRCEKCGIEIDFSGGKGLKSNGPSLDRIYNENIMNNDNTAILCWQCNVSKNKFSDNNFIDMCKRVVAVDELRRTSL